MTDTFYPSGFFYSHFGTKLALPYSLTMIGFAIATFFVYVYQWMKFDEKQQNYRLFKKDNIVFARIVINCWDWRRDTMKGARDQLKILDLDSKEALNDARIKEQADLRDEDSKINLWFRRAYLIFLTLLVMAGGWVGIAFVCYYENQFYKLFYQYNKFMATWFPMMFIATINLIMRPLISLISKMEGWDFELDR